MDLKINVCIDLSDQAQQFLSTLLGRAVAPVTEITAMEPVAEATEVTEVAKPSVSRDDLVRAATSLLQSGTPSGTLRDVITSFGVNALPELSESDFDACAQKLRALGATI